MRRYFLIFFLFIGTLFGSIYDKSVLVYYGDDISYTTAGIHDYIIVQPKHTNTDLPGFQIYKNKMYAYVSIGEMAEKDPVAKKIKKEWIQTRNTQWKSLVLDIKNKAYQEFLFTQLIEPQRKRGFQNFFFDTLDSYQLYSKNAQQRKANEAALIAFIHEFHRRYPDAKLIINRGFEIIDAIYKDIQAVLFESYYKGLDTNPKGNGFVDVSQKDREWFDVWIKKLHHYHKDVISVEYMKPQDIFSQKSDFVVKKIKAKGMIPYIANKALDIYGKSSKTAIKREIFTLVSEINLDRTEHASHRYGAFVLEYLGYKQKLYAVRKGLPKVAYMQHYAGVLIWLQDYYKEPKKLLKWVKKLIKNGIKVVFVNNFGFAVKSSEALDFLGIKVHQATGRKIAVDYANKHFIGYEIEPSLRTQSTEIEVKNARELLRYRYSDDTTSTPAAITPWGGYMVDDGVMVNIDGENMWVMNPFIFFQEVFHLKKIPVADVTTESGKRILFSHVDGDGLANKVEGNFGTYSGDVILHRIIQRYPLPISISIIGSDVDPNGVFKKIHKELVAIVKDIYKYPHVEGASHTYSHPFFWNKIHNGELSPLYRLKVPGYHFSLKKELFDTLQEINTKFYPPKKQPKAQTIFWSGDCTPQLDALSFIYKHKLLAINGGDTTITKTHPWLSRIAPLGLERDGYAQIFTGAQNENVFTNDWLGPFWGFKRVVQTFELTNSPNRYKPIDIYFHLYSGSKQASIEALEYVFDWAMKQDTIALFTSEYIPKVIEFYNYAVATDRRGNWLFCGLDKLNTIRIEHAGVGVDFRASHNVVGITHYKNHTYLSLAQQKRTIVKLQRGARYKRDAYLVSANAHLKAYSARAKQKTYFFQGHLPLQLRFHLPKRCRLRAYPQPQIQEKMQEDVSIGYERATSSKVSITCF